MVKIIVFNVQNCCVILLVYLLVSGATAALYWKLPNTPKNLQKPPKTTKNSKTAKNRHKPLKLQKSPKTTKNSKSLQKPLKTSKSYKNFQKFFSRSGSIYFWDDQNFQHFMTSKNGLDQSWARNAQRILSKIHVI